MSVIAREIAKVVAGGFFLSLVVFPIYAGLGWLGWWSVNLVRTYFGYTPYEVGPLEIAAVALFVLVGFAADHIGRALRR